MGEDERDSKKGDPRTARLWDWVWPVALLATVLVFIAKVWQTDFSGALDGFQFSDLLALFLAMFAIALAILFYIKATETSNIFYDNTYRFTRDVSEILGRVEAGFGEKLAHLDEGYSGLKSAVERLPFDRAETEKEIEDEERELQRVQKEKAEILEQLASRARLQEREKAEIMAQLESKDKELHGARRELHFLRRRMAEQLGEPVPHHMWPPRLRQFFDGFRADLEEAGAVRSTPREISQRLEKFLEEQATPLVRRDLMRLDVIDSEGSLTPHGYRLIRGFLD